MKKTGTKDTLNLIFSAFLILGYIICSYFFLTMGATTEFAIYIQLAVFTVFGLVLFYATRVGEGKPVKRFSLWTLIIIVIPALYAIIATLVPAMPLHNEIANLGTNDVLTYSPLFILACVALGYGIPYTFLSGFETQAEDAFETVEETEDGCACECCKAEEVTEDGCTCECCKAEEVTEDGCTCECCKAETVEAAAEITEEASEDKTEETEE